MKEKTTVINRVSAVFLITALLFIGFSVYFFIHRVILWGVLSLLFAAVALVSDLLVPLYYTFDKRGVTAVYPTTDKEIYLYKNIESVSCAYDMIIPYFFDTLYISGEDETYYRFYKEGRIALSKKTVALFSEYGKICAVGVMPDGLKGYKKRQSFKLRYQKRPDESEAKKAELAVRRTARATVNGHGLTNRVKLSYSYVSEDGASDKRPVISSTYVLTVSTLDGSVKREIECLRLTRRRARLAVNIIDFESSLDELLGEAFANA